MNATDEVRLDNPVYAALSGPHVGFAQTRGRALRYSPDLAPFFALPTDPSEQDWEDAMHLVKPGTIAAIVHHGLQMPPPWQVIREYKAVQMIGEHVAGSADPEATALGRSEVSDMLELVAKTDPGPFLDRTIELGRYLGIQHNGVLVAMAGERLHFDGWREISGVCTAPTHRGQGLASRLVSAIIEGIQSRSERSFLHVLKTNTNAIRLYERLGFRVRRNVTISAMTPGAVPPGN